MIDFLGSFYIIDSKRTMCRKKREYLNGTEKIWKILLKLAPPVMFAQLIQALYNIVDSYFVGKYSPDGFTALSVIFPIQLIITALAVGTGMVLSFLTWIIFAVTAVLMMHGYVATSAKSAQTVDYGVIYGNIVCAGSLGIYLESIWTKVHQAEGNMRTPDDCTGSSSYPRDSWIPNATGFTGNEKLCTMDLPIGISAHF